MNTIKKEYKMIGGGILIALVAFFIGTKFSQAKAAPVSGQYAAAARGAQGASRTRFGGAVAGEILSKDDTSLTVKLQSGGTRIVFLSASTTVSKLVEGALGDLATGETVLVTGEPNEDGSVTASSVDIRPLPAMNRASN